MLCTARGDAGARWGIHAAVLLLAVLGVWLAGLALGTGLCAAAAAGDEQD